MKERSLGIIIGILNIILLAVGIVLFLGRDKVAPVITIGECNYVYEEDLPEGLLYQGVTAYDETDGELTDQVVIEKIVTDRENGKATITYGVSDASGNVGKATRNLAMPVLTRVQFPGAGEAGSMEAVETVTGDREAETEALEEANMEEADAEVETAGDEEETQETTEETEETNTEETVEDDDTQEEASEENETTENEGEGTATGGNVTVVGSNNRRN